MHFQFCHGTGRWDPLLSLVWAHRISFKDGRPVPQGRGAPRPAPQGRGGSPPRPALFVGGFPAPLCPVKMIKKAGKLRGTIKARISTFFDRGNKWWNNITTLNNAQSSLSIVYARESKKWKYLPLFLLFWILLMLVFAWFPNGVSALQIHFWCYWGAIRLHFLQTACLFLFWSFCFANPLISWRVTRVTLSFKLHDYAFLAMVTLEGIFLKE